MDLSQLSNEDLAALAAGDMGKMSDAGLKHITGQASPAPQAPTQTETPLDRVKNFGAKFDAGLKGGDMAMSMLPGAKMGAMGATALRRMLTNTGVGALQGAVNAPEGEKLQGAKTGALLGGGLSGGAEAVGGLAGLLKWGSRHLARMTAPQAEAYATNPKAVGAMQQALEDPSQMYKLEDQAAGAINASRRDLRAQGLEKASKLRQLLEGKSLEINPSQYQGVSPEADSLLEQAVSRGLNGTETVGNAANVAPKSISLPANEANALKRALQSAASFSEGTVMDPVQKARFADAASKAQGLRRSIEGLSPEITGLNNEMQQGMTMQSGLRKGLKNPLAFISSETPGRQALFSRAENAGAGGLQDFGNQLGAAKAATSKDVGSGVPTFMTKAAGRAGIRAADSLQGAGPNSAPFTQLLIKRLFEKDDTNK